MNETLQSYDHWSTKTLRVEPGTIYYRRTGRTKEGEDTFRGPYSVFGSGPDACTGQDAIVLTTPLGSLLVVTLNQLATWYERRDS